METKRENLADMGSDGHRGSKGISIFMPKCCHQCQRGRLLIVWLSLMSTLEEVLMVWFWYMKLTEEYGHEG
jgi:hypothetical protein